MNIKALIEKLNRQGEQEKIEAGFSYKSSVLPEEKRPLTPSGPAFFDSSPSAKNISGVNPSQVPPKFKK